MIHWLQWDDGKLWAIAGGLCWRIPPLAEMKSLVLQAACQLGFPSGARLAQWLGDRYYWHGLVCNCITLCNEYGLVQLNRRDFKPGVIFFPTYKGREPFKCWCIDLVTHLKGLAGMPTIMVVVVCPFSKQVESAPLPDRSSSIVACWLHSEVVCRYGTPRFIRCDCGGEF